MREFFIVKNFKRFNDGDSYSFVYESLYTNRDRVQLIEREMERQEKFKYIWHLPFFVFELFVVV